jgi:hypothetical protein
MPLIPARLAEAIIPYGHASQNRAMAQRAKAIALKASSEMVEHHLYEQKVHPRDIMLILRQDETWARTKGRPWVKDRDNEDVRKGKPPKSLPKQLADPDVRRWTALFLVEAQLIAKAFSLDLHDPIVYANALAVASATAAPPSNKGFNRHLMLTINAFLKMEIALVECRRCCGQLIAFRGVPNCVCPICEPDRVSAASRQEHRRRAIGGVEADTASSTAIASVRSSIDSFAP